MVTLEDLKSKASKNVSGIQENVILYINNDSEVGGAIVSLLEIFDEDDKEHIIRLISKGKDVGYIKQTDLYDYIRPLPKDSLDSFGGYDITGYPLPDKKYKCPYAYQSCNQSYNIVGENIDEIPVHKCNIHNKIMILDER